MMLIMASDTDMPIDVVDPFARRLMARYLKRREADIGRLRLALGSADFDSIQTTGHKLLGSGAAYGLEKISHLGQRLETAALARDAETAQILEDIRGML